MMSLRAFGAESREAVFVIGRLDELVSREDLVAYSAILDPSCELMRVAERRVEVSTFPAPCLEAVGGVIIQPEIGGGLLLLASFADFRFHIIYQLSRNLPRHVRYLRGLIPR